MALLDDLDHGVEQRMAGTEELGGGLARHVDELLLEADALIALEDGHRAPPPRLPVTHVAGHARDLVALGLALADTPAELLEGGDEERTDEVRLELARLRPLHVLADALDVGGPEVVGGDGLPIA